MNRESSFIFQRRAFQILFIRIFIKIPTNKKKSMEERSEKKEEKKLKDP